MKYKIAVIMGSDSDYEIMKLIIPILQKNDVDYDFRVISAHRTPWTAAEFARNAKTSGYDLFIAGAGMSAHLPGVLAAFTGLPVIGVPLKSDLSGMDGMDALHSVIQMPPGIPVATVGIDHTEGAARLAIKMINCYCGLDISNNIEPIVKIVHDRNEINEANLKKVVKTLDVYGIKHILADTVDVLHQNSNTFAIINLTNTNIEKNFKSDEYAKRIPIIEVPLRASSDKFNETSNKVYYQTEASETTAFVGVNSYQNAAHIIARIVGIHNPAVYDEVVSEHSKLAAAVIEKDSKIRSIVNDGKLK